MTKRVGFSLLEILIVVALIGILVSIGVVSYGAAQKRSRDSKRRADMRVMQNAMEQYYADTTQYPATASPSCNPGAAYLPGGLPVDPKSGQSYDISCATSGGNSTYCACALLEGSATSGNATAKGTPCAFGAGQFYCLGNLQ